MATFSPRWLFALLLAGLLLAPVAAQHEQPPNGLLLVAKPGIADPNFARSVVLVTQAPDYSTIGVILNRPTRVRPGQAHLAEVRVLQVVVALFRRSNAKTPRPV